MWRWGKDDYNTGYRIFTFLYSRLLGIDIYLFHYPEGSWIPKHKDPGKYGPHYRFNIELKKTDVGGEFKCSNKIFSLWNRVQCFRADTNYHRVTKIQKGSRWVLSFGWTNRFKGKR